MAEAQSSSFAATDTGAKRALNRALRIAMQDGGKLGINHNHQGF